MSLMALREMFDDPKAVWIVEGVIYASEFESAALAASTSNAVMLCREEK